MINWFGDFEYRLLLNNTKSCVDLIENNELSLNYDFSDDQGVEISCPSLFKNETNNCLKGNSIKYKLNKENRTFDVLDVYWSN